MNRWSLRYKMMVLVLIGTSLCFILVGVSNYSSAKELIIASLKDNASSKISTRAYNLSVWLQNKKAEVEAMSRTEQVRFGSKDEKLQYLHNELERSQGSFNWIGFSDVEGNLTFTSGRQINIRSEVTFGEVLKGNSMISDAFTGQMTNDKIFTIQVPVFGETDQVIGLVNASFRVETAFLQYTNFKVGREGTTLLFTKGGQIIYHPDSLQIGYDHITDDQSLLKSMAGEMMNGTEGAGVAGEGEEEQLVFYSQVGGTPWHMVLEVPISEFEEPLKSLFWKTLITIMATEGVLIWLLMLIINREIKRIRGIVSVTEQVAEGHFDLSPIPVENQDEIGALAQSVNGMMAHLKEMFERLEAIINQNDFAIMSLDENYKINYFSKNAEKMLGYQAEELMERGDPSCIVAPEELEQVAAELSAMLGRTVSPDVSVFHELRRLNFSYDREWTFVRKDGTRFPVAHNSNGLRDRNGRFIGVVSISRDITEHKRVQQELIQAKQEAEEANLAKGHFLARMSHEIRTPLNGILGLSQLMQKTDLTDVQEDYMRKIVSSSRALLRIINDILDFSKVEAGKLELDRVVFHPEKIMNRLAELLSVFMGGKEQFEVIIDTPEVIPDALIGDPIRLQQILLNISNNAVKFTHKGYVRITMKVIEETAEAVKLRFLIEDTGIGITEEQLEKLFQPFTQADGSTSRKYGGTGLGLVIADSLIQMMGGQLEVSSRHGVGSTFAFTICFDRSPQSHGVEHRLGEGYGIQPVWIVEDNVMMLEHLSDMLIAYSLQSVTPFTSWKVAAAALAEEEKLAPEGRKPCRVALLDMEMPDMYGAETWIQFQQAAKRAGMITVAMTTAYGRDEMLGMPLEERPDGIIVKPFTRSGLFQTLESVLTRSILSDHEGTGSMSQTLHAPMQARHKSGGRILLAEDNEINQQVAVEMLSYQGYHVEVARNGREVLDKLHEGAWDLVLMDIHMPEMDGIEATRTIRSDPRFRRLPLIAMTANVMKSDHENYLRIGMNDIITKPLESGQMFVTIRKWLGESTIGTQAEVAKVNEQHGLPVVQGMDVPSALSRVNGKSQILWQMIKTFEQDYTDFARQLQEALEEGRSQDAKRLVHTLKGAAGSLSAARLYKAAVHLEASMAMLSNDAAVASEGDAGDANLEAAIRELSESLEQLLLSFGSLH